MAGDLRSYLDGLKPVGGMVLVQVVFAGVNILYKLAASDQMDLRVLVAYRNLVGTAFLAPLAFLFERKNHPRLTWKILTQSFFCGLFGSTLTQNLYLVAIKLTSATFASSMTNLVPAITFVFAVIFRLEKLRFRTVSGQAKVLGTLVGLGGAMLITVYKGPEIVLWSSGVNLLHHSDYHGGGGTLTAAAAAAPQESGNRVTGSLLAVASCVSYAIWLIIQAKVSVSYPCLYSSTAMMCLMSSLQSVAYALSMQRDWAQWRMGLDVRLITVVYAGVVASGLILSVMAWCIRMKGPLFASVFNPLMLVLVAFLGSILLDEKLHLGTVLGSALIVVGLYLVLWGKGREAAKVVELPVTSHSGSSRQVAAESLEVVTGSGPGDRTKRPEDASNGGEGEMVSTV